MRYSVSRPLLKLALLNMIAVAFSALLAVAHGLALEDALRDRIDAENFKKVAAYLNSTWFFRTVGFVLLLGFWSVIAFVIDRVVDNAAGRDSTVKS